MDIENYFKGEKKFAGVFSNDELTPKKNVAYILNLENASEGGSHWTLLCNGWYFDPYGVVATKRMSKFVKTISKGNYQGINSTACGYFCLYVADHIFAGLPPTGDLVPNQQKHNENILENYFYGSK